MQFLGKKYAILVAALGLFAVLAMGASSCDPNAATTSAMCGYVIGDGSSGHDAKIHKIVYPNEQVHVGDHEDVKYVPCNSRNFLITPASTNVNGQKVGDRNTASIAYTKEGTKVRVWTSSYWTLNQDKTALSKFWDVCLKYNCASSDPGGSGTVNFSTPGWNGLLSENFGPSVDNAAFNEVAKFSDAIWQKHSPNLYKQLSLYMSDAFSEAVRTKTGYNTDLFCGSGNSVWTGDQGNSTFNCRNVRIQVNDVEPYNEQLSTGVDQTTKANQDQSINAKRLRAAKELYGSSAGYWLGLQDTLEKCKASTVCVINIGGGSSTVSIPTPKG